MPHVQGIDLLRHVKALLEDADCERDALVTAAGEFWSATFDSESWPAVLRAKSLPARYRLQRGGSFEEVVRRLDDAELRKLCHELIEIAELADRLDRSPG